VAASLAPCVSRRLTERRLDISTVQWGYETKFDGYSIAPGASVEELRASLATVEAALIPCSEGAIDRELVRLKMKTAARGLSEQDLAMQLVIYAEDLGAYPEDVVVGVLRPWPDSNKWWPTWRELKVLLDERCERRRALQAALLAAIGSALWTPPQ
jgi:hypothetical protein